MGKSNITPAYLAALAKGDLSNAIADATTGGIEAQEAHEQTKLVSNFNRLPIDGLKHDVMARLGFTIGGVVDDLFLMVEPPAGWALVPTEHSMWSDLLDEQGRKRGGVFYKGAFYDRKASMRLSCRYRVEADYGDENIPLKQRVVSAFVLDASAGEKKWQADPVPYLDFDAQHAIEDGLKEKLFSEFPENANPEAYW